MNRLIALDFTNLYIRAVNGKVSGGKISVDHAASVPLPGYMDADGAADQRLWRTLCAGFFLPVFRQPGNRVGIEEQRDFQRIRAAL